MEGVDIDVGGFFLIIEEGGALLPAAAGGLDACVCVCVEEGRGGEWVGGRMGKREERGGGGGGCVCICVWTYLRKGHRQRPGRLLVVG